MPKNRKKKRRPAQEAKEEKPRTLASPEASPRLRRLYLLVTAFCAGAAIMIVELAGNRILAPWFGNSLYTWTGLIGVILVCISVGYYLGGLVADYLPRWTVLAHILGGAAISTSLIPVLQVPLEGVMDRMDIVTGPVIASLCCFAVPGILLGAVSPFAIRLTSLLSSDRKVGLSAGKIGMLSTLGSVIGTFAAGFVLIPHFSLQSLFFTSALVLGILAAAGYILFMKRSGKKPVLIIIIFLFIFLTVAVKGRPWVSEGIEVVFDKTTFYHRIRVIESKDSYGIIRAIYLDTTREGGQYVNSKRLPVEYQKFWELSRIFTPDLETAVFLGGGAFTMPEVLLDAFPEAQVDVVELDPHVIDIGRKYFRLDAYPRLKPIAGDARRYLRITDRKYDLVFGDAYNGVQAIPAHLVTREFFEVVEQRLTEDGVFMMNVVSAVEGEGAILANAVHKTLSAVFEHIWVFSNQPSFLKTHQNLIFVAANHDLPVAELVESPTLSAAGRRKFKAGFLENSLPGAGKGILLTDERNPVEYIVARTRVR